MPKVFLPHVPIDRLKGLVLASLRSIFPQSIQLEQSVGAKSLLYTYTFGKTYDIQNGQEPNFDERALSIASEVENLTKIDGHGKKCVIWAVNVEVAVRTEKYLSVKYEVSVRYVE